MLCSFVWPSFVCPRRPCRRCSHPTGAELFSAAESELSAYKVQHGVTPEYLEALSWMARAEAATKQWDQAERYATDTRSSAEQQLSKPQQTRRRSPSADRPRRRLRSSRPGRRGKRTARASRQPAAHGIGALWKYFHSSAASEESQPSRSGRSTRAAAYRKPNISDRSRQLWHR